MSIQNTATELTEALRPKPTPAPYDTQATVIRVEEDTLWVHIPGGVDETPVQRTINANPGDVIQVRISGGSAWAQGNATAPPTDDTRANVAHQTAEVAQETADEALELARLKVGRAEIDEAVINTLQTNDISCKNLSVIDDDGNIIATFYGAAITLGESGNSQVALDAKKLRFTTSNGHSYFAVEDFRDSSGYATYTNQFVGDGQTLGFLLSAVPSNTPTVTVDGVAESGFSMRGTILLFSQAPQDGAIIVATYQSDSDTAVAMTFGARPSGQSPGAFSFAQGSGVSASGMYSSAAGLDSTASGYASHAEGTNATASGNSSHAEGSGTMASGLASHASGEGTIASGTAQTAIGKYNDPDGTMLFIVGNGTDDDNRSNALTVDRSGNLTASGVITASKIVLSGYVPVCRRTKTITGTTSSTGYISLDLGSNYGILCVRRTDSGSICQPYWSTVASGWYAHITTTGATPSAVASTAVTLEVEHYYKNTV